MSLMFFDLFSGIGGFRHLLYRIDEKSKCLFATDNDIQAVKSKL